MNTSDVKLEEAKVTISKEEEVLRMADRRVIELENKRTSDRFQSADAISIESANLRN